MSSSNRIEKKMVVKAPRSRVWRAVSDSKEFGTWFRLKLDSPFIAGATTRGNITFPGYEHLTAELHVEKVEPEHHLAFRWHPYAVDPKVDYSAEPMTLVEFRLKEVPEGTEVTVVESGFDALPAHRRDEAFRMNDVGWTQQMDNLRAHVG